MTAAEILQELHERGVEVLPEGESLRIIPDAPADLRPELLRLKGELLDLLTARTGSRCPICAEAIRRGAEDSLCRDCPDWGRIFGGLVTPEAREAARRELLERRGARYRRADPERRCESCRALEARGVAVLACSECDVLVEGLGESP